MKTFPRETVYISVTSIDFLKLHSQMTLPTSNSEATMYSERHRLKYHESLIQSRERNQLKYHESLI